jgi:hypothetical protein
MGMNKYLVTLRIRGHSRWRGQHQHRYFGQRARRLHEVHEESIHQFGLWAERYASGARHTHSKSESTLGHCFKLKFFGEGVYKNQLKMLFGACLTFRPGAIFSEQN